MKKQILKTIISLTSVGFLFNGCGSLKLSEYTPVSIPKTQKIQKAKLERVVFIPFETKGLYATPKVKKAIGKRFPLRLLKKINKYSTVVDAIHTDKRSSIKNIFKERKYKDVNYIVSGKVCDLSLQNKLTLGTITVYQRNGKSKDYIFDSQLISGQADFDKIVDAAMVDTSFQIPNYIGVKGYITEMRKKDNSKIIAVNTKKGMGVRSGDDVKIYTIEKGVEKIIGEGEYLTVGKNSSWVEIDKLYVPTVKIGDFVREYDTGIFKTDRMVRKMKRNNKTYCK